MNPASAARFAWPAHAGESEELRVEPGAFTSLRARVVASQAEVQTLRLNFADAAPFLAVTPLGMPARSRLQRMLADFSIGVRGCYELADWPRTATLLYVRRADEAELARGAAYELAWRSQFAPLAEIWTLAGWPAYERLRAAKYEIRAHFRAHRRTVEAAGRVVKVKLHAFHVPDPLRLPIEAHWVRAGDI